MKKVFALGVTGLLMLGTASQASAYFEAGDFILSIYDNTNKQELGIDLGKFDLTKSATLATGLNTSLSGFDFTSTTSGVGVFANYYNAATYAPAGYFAITDSSATTATVNGTISNGTSFNNADKSIRGALATADTNTDGIALLTANSYASQSYHSAMDVTTAGGYAGVQKSAGKEGDVSTTAGGYVDLYLYQFAKVGTSLAMVNNVNGEAGTNYVGTIRLTQAGDVLYTANAVPVPGAAWLLGSGILGLAGLRRRKNS